jgi:hypothetical protein
MSQEPSHTPPHPGAAPGGKDRVPPPPHQIEPETSNIEKPPAVDCAITCRLDLANESELNFLYKCWKGALLVDGKLPRQVVFKLVELWVEGLRDRGAEFRCLRNPAREEQIFGVSVVQAPVAHFVYVKRWLRRQGFGAILLQGCRYATYYTPAAQSLMDKLNMRRIDL